MKKQNDPKTKDLIKASELPAFGIDFSRTTHAQLEYLKRFPKRVRLAANTVVYDRCEIERWIEDRKKDRDNTHYADPF